MKTLLFLLFLFCPARAADVAEVVSQFYNRQALDLRSLDEGKSVERLSELLTPSFRAAIAEARQTIKAWQIAAKKHPGFFKDLKPPPDEGPLFTSFYEGGKFAGVVSSQIAGDRAYVIVSVSAEPLYPKQTWTDLLVLHQVGSGWLIDDILSRTETGNPISIRENFNLPAPPEPDKVDRSDR